MLRNKGAIFMASMLLFLIFLSIDLAAEIIPQQKPTGKYPKGRIFLKSGLMIDGINIELMGKSVNMMVDGDANTYQISDIQYIMVKKGRASKFAQSCCLGCLGLFGIAYAGGAYDNSGLESGQLAFGFAFWAGVSAGIGYFIGYISDDWATIYYAPTLSSKFGSSNPGVLCQNPIKSKKSKNDFRIVLLNGAISQ